MNLENLHKGTRPLSTYKLIQGTNTKGIAIQLKVGGLLDKHTTAIPALLVCISGCTRYQDENGQSEELQSGDYIHIRPNVVHWLEGLALSQLVLVQYEV